MARSLDQIITELNATYQPQKDQYSQAIQSVDPSQQAEEQGLNAAKTDAFAQIDQSANRRGLYYAGIPLAEEQKYTGANFLPALANMRTKYAQQKFDLTNALNKVTQDEYNQANGIHQTELDREEKQREFDAQLAAQTAAARSAAAGSAGASPGFDFGSLLGGSDASPAAPTNGQVGMQQRADKGFNFFDSNGHAITAAQYAHASGADFYGLLKQMAAAGDRGAATGLTFIGNDANADPTKVTSQSLANLYRALTGRSVGVYQKPTNRVSNPYGNFVGHNVR